MLQQKRVQITNRKQKMIRAILLQFTTAAKLLRAPKSTASHSVSRSSALALITTLSCSFHVSAQTPPPVPQPICADGFLFDSNVSACIFDRTKAKTEDECSKIQGVSWNKASNICLVTAAPAAVCTKPYAFRNGGCVREASAPTSSPGNYAGDCFRIVAPPSGSDLVQGETYAVLDPKTPGEDPTLKLVKSNIVKDGYLKAWINCQPNRNLGPNDKVHELTASSLSAAGAVRTGWAYGVLLLPYKYHKDDKSFGASVSVGPYVGKRVDAFGASYTVAITAGIGSVVGTIDPALINLYQAA